VLSLYRVFPFLASAPADAPGGALYVPAQGAGRLDNPDLFSVLYLSDAPAGSVAEAFGRFPIWTAAVLQGSPALSGSVRALARYRLRNDTRLCDLDDPHRLVKLHLRPSQIVSRDYTGTRSWARRIHLERGWIGVKWWSYYDPQWASVGLWNTRGLALEEVRPLHLDDDAVVEAGRTIFRRIVRDTR